MRSVMSAATMSPKARAGNIVSGKRLVTADTHHRLRRILGLSAGSGPARAVGLRH